MSGTYIKTKNGDSVNMLSAYGVTHQIITYINIKVEKEWTQTIKIVVLDSDLINRMMSMHSA